MIVCFASDAANVATAGETVIGAAMTNIVIFCRGLAWKVKHNGNRLSCLTPGAVVDTPLYRRLKEGELSRRLFSKAKCLESLGVVNAADLAELVVLLAGPAAARIAEQPICATCGNSVV